MAKKYHDPKHSAMLGSLDSTGLPSKVIMKEWGPREGGFEHHYDDSLSYIDGQMKEASKIKVDPRKV